ncbi:MAG TPA: hypothetical protein VFQ74_00940 [Pseudolysinimonas sp.]|nr:hypothetical protein [Pseudolysinimonas sp.]
MVVIVGALLIVAAIVGGAVALVRRESSAVGWAVAQLALVAAAGILTLLMPAAETAWSIPLAICAVLAATFGGGIVVKVVLRLAGHPQAIVDDLPAAAWIGLVERFAMTFALVLGRAEIAAVIIAVKALGAYSASADGAGSGRDRNRMASVRVLGTLTSVTWALLCYAVYAVARTRMAA